MRDAPLPLASVVRAETTTPQEDTVPKTRQSPGHHFEVIRTYGDFEDYIRAFADGKFSLLVIVGRPGISKSESIPVSLACNPTSSIFAANSMLW